MDEEFDQTAGSLGQLDATRFGDGAHIDRVALAPGIDVCFFRYRETSGARRSAVAHQLEVGVQLAGELSQRGHMSGVTHSGPGQLHVLGHAETYDVDYRAGASEGLAAPCVSVVVGRPVQSRSV